LGSNREIPVDLRLIAATNRDPEEAVKIGQLRQDLYYRLQSKVLYVPALRERAEDIPALADHFIRLVSSTLSRTTPVSGIEEPALQALQRYSWPGNVRE